MEGIDSNELWRQIPPEEKLELMARAQSKGFSAAAVVILVACTLAVGLKVEALMWVSFVISPLIFQFAAGKGWRDLRPILMLEYLGARSAARRYAFAHQSKDMGVQLIFRGHFEELFDQDQVGEALEALANHTDHSEVWVVLFTDAVVVMSERFGGAELKFCSLINARLDIQSESPQSGQEYASDHQVILSPKTKDKGTKRFKLTSKYPAALIVFEKKLQMLLQAVKAQTDLSPKLVGLDAPLDDDTDKLFGQI